MSVRIPVFVFAKAPRSGATKTRLVPALGAETAAALAEAFLDDTLAQLAATPWIEPVIATDRPDLVSGRFPGVRVVDQGVGPLGARLHRVLSEGLQRAPAVLALGADTPGLPERVLTEARDALDGADAVLGPAADGGFTLIGLHRCPEGLFSRLPWSQPGTLAAMEARLAEHGMRVSRTEPWFDVDTPADLALLREALASGRIAAPHTAAVLARTRGGPWLSVVLPVLDEAARIGPALERLTAQPGIDEVVVVDGGSRDDTVERAERVPGVRVCSATRGRGSQMNAGARAAFGQVLCFLHVDATLPADAARHVARALEQDGVVGGAFRTRTVSEPGGRWWSALLSIADVRSRRTRWPYGDQALFVRRTAFERAGGFPEQRLMEDVELSRRLWTLGRLVTVSAVVTVSGRRFLRRPVRTLLAWNAFPVLYRAGVPVEWLARFYGDVR